MKGQNKKKFWKIPLFFAIVCIGFLLVPEKIGAHNTNATWDQEHFWFRDDDGSESAATGYGTGNLAVDASIGAAETFAVGQAFRLRMALLKNNNGDLALSTTPKLQFKAGGTTGSCTTDTWTDVPTQTAGGQAFTQATSANFADGAATTLQVDAAHTLVGGDMIEIDGAANSATFGIGTSTDHAEWEWMLDSDSAAASTIYTFRVIPSTGGTYTNYTLCPTLETDAAATATLTQNDFEFWYDNDATNPVDVIGTPDIAENSPLNAIPVHNEAPTSTVEIRMRMNMTVGAANISVDTVTLKLQYATSTITSLACSSETTSNFKDVEANGSTAAWSFALSSVTDGTSITPSITASDVGKYAKTNTNTNPAANNGDDLEFDWHIQKDINANGATYCFRAVKSAGDLDAYNSDSYPRITTAPGSENILRHGNFFDQVEEKGFYWAN